LRRIGEIDLQRRSLRRKVFVSKCIVAALASVAMFVASSTNAASINIEFLTADNSFGVNALLAIADTPNGIFNGTSAGFDILSISGVVTGPGGGDIASLLTNPNQPFSAVDLGFQYDNVAFLSEPHLNLNGVLFSTVGGDVWNLWSVGAGNYQLYSYTANGGVNVLGGFSVAAVPEPEPYALMVAGLGIVGLMSRRRLAF
jgi:hypothetical protein